jgi:sec-independent protein translocase protein TatB
MFEFDFFKLIIIAMIALLVLGPEKLPGLAAKLGQWAGRARAVARQLRTQLEQEVMIEEDRQRREKETAKAAKTPPPPPSPEPETPHSPEPEAHVAQSTAEPAHSPEQAPHPTEPVLDLDVYARDDAPTPVSEPVAAAPAAPSASPIPARTHE